MTRQTLVISCGSLALCLGLAHTLAAQMPQTGSTTGGTSASRSTASRSTASRSSGQATAGFARTQSGGYALDPRFQTGSAGIGQTTAGAGAATSGAFGQSANQMGGQNRFGGMTGIGGMAGMGRMGMMGGMAMGRNMMGTQNQQMGRGNTAIRTQMRLGFSEPMPPASVVNSRFSSVVSRVLERADYGGSGQVTLVMEGQTAVLTGTVASDHARDVIERLALLEPGIADVRNELTVSPDEPTP